jgi:hypothetical protein
VRSIDISPRNGTLDDASDQDEEGIVEMAIPLASLGLSGRARGVRTRTCVTWGSERSEIVLR